MPTITQALPVAEELRDLLRDSCTRIRIAGSVRRRAPQVSDIELVCEPALVEEPGTLFEGRLVSALDLRIADLLATPPAPLSRMRGDSDGPRYKRLRFRGIKVDLFVVRPPATWGVIYAIRTGPAGFARLLVRPRWLGGALPNQMKVAGGQLLLRGDEVIPTATETEFFAAIGLPWWPPRERTEAKLLDYLGSKTTSQRRV